MTDFPKKTLADWEKLALKDAGEGKTLADLTWHAPEGFGEEDVKVVRDNARQLKFKPESTGFE